MKGKHFLAAFALTVTLLMLAVAAAQAVGVAGEGILSAVINSGGGYSSAGNVELFGSIGGVTGNTSTIANQQDGVTHGIWYEPGYHLILPVVFNNEGQ